MTVEERVIEALKRLRGFDLDLEPQDAQRLYKFNIQSLTEDFTAIIEDCAKLTDDESIRLDGLSIEYKQKGDLDTAIRFSANVVTAAKLGRDIRALAGMKEEGVKPA